MEYLPLFVDLKNKFVLIIGGGSVAARKVQILKKTGAIIKIIALELCLDLKKQWFDGKIIWIKNSFQPSMLDSVVLVIVASNDIPLNNFVYNNAKNRCILINSVDDIDQCSCIFPAIIDRSPILIGISSCGTAPMLVRILREKFEILLPQFIGILARLAGKWRDIVKKYISNITCRRRFWEKIFYHSHISFLIEKGLIQEADQELKNAIICKNVFYDNKRQGSIALVGAGPGDSGLLTIKGLQMIQRADVILYDYLINKEILDFARRDANKICVGKYAQKHSISQEKINRIIVYLAKRGNRVVRLKGGDPFIFGRGGEELQYIFATTDIPCQVIPGITAAIGSAAYAGIPLTHRQYAHSVNFITGHNLNRLNWNSFLDPQQTLVIYMGRLNIKYIGKNLILHGRCVKTPVAVISHGTYKHQKVVIGKLMELDSLIDSMESPMLLIVGNVVLLHSQINWFDQKVSDINQDNDDIINFISK